LTGNRRLDRAAIVVALAFTALAAGAGPAHAAEQQSYAAAMNFAPPTVTIGQGDTLVFNNLDTLAKHDLVGHDGKFGSDLLGGGESGPVRGVETLETGQYDFHCTLHGWMKGVMTVGPAGSGGVGAPSIQGGGGTGTGSITPDPIDIWPQASPEPLGQGNWPFYGHDLSNTRDGGLNGPSAAEVPNLGPAWSFHSHHGDFTATPVIDQNILVAGSNGGYVFGLNATTGKQIWQYNAGKPINGTSAISNGKVFVPVAEVHAPKLIALDLKTGRELWKTQISDQKNSDVYGSPVAWRGRVFMGTSAEYGELNDPKVDTRGTVVAVGAKRGKLLWQTYAVPEGHDGGAVWTTPAIDDETGRLYVGTGNAYHDPAAETTDAVLAIDARTGTLLGHKQATPGDSWNGSEAAGTDYDFGASPNLIEGPMEQKLVGMGQKSGTYWAWDRASLDVAWQATVAPGTPVVGGVVGATAYDGTRIYGPSTTAGEEWAIDRSGAFGWVSTDGGPLHFNPTSVANGVVYTTDMSGFLTAREAMTGAPLIKIPLGSPTWGGVAIAGGSVFAAIGTQGNAGYIVSYRVRNGDESSRAANHWEEEPAPKYDRPAEKKVKAKKGKKGKKRCKKKRGATAAHNEDAEADRPTKTRKRCKKKRRGGRSEDDGQREGDEPADPEEVEEEGHHGGGTGGGGTKGVRQRADRYVPKPPGTTQRLNLYYGPYTIPPGWDANRVDLDLPTTDGFMLSVQPVMMRADDLSEPSHQEAHIHHAHWFGIDPGNKEDTYLGHSAEWIFGMGDEGTRGDFRERSAANPKGPVYGNFIRKGQEQTLIYMLHNKTDQPMEVYIVLKVAFQHGTAEELERIVGRPYHDVAGALFGRTYDVPRKPDGDGTYQYARDSGRVIEWTVPEDGTLIGAGGHVHPGGKRVVMENYGSVDNACPSDGRGYGGTLMLKSDVIDREAPLSEDYQTEVTHPAWRAPVHKGDRIRISGTYENRDHAWYTVMTHLGMYFDKAQKPMGRCRPYMIADKKWKPTEGVPNRSWGHHTDTFCGEEWGHEPCDHEDKGPPAPEIRTNLVKILNFAYLPGDRAASGQIASVPVIKQGEELTFVNDDQLANIRHSVTTCASPCNGKYVANYPLADGRWDSGILGFDLIDGGSPNPVSKTPPDLGAGQYRYFCRIHPWMRGEFKVEPR
jgi:polyvinyl alcohol dehydrogenase (cytochrome)